MAKERLQMKLCLTEQRLEGKWTCRHLTADDIPALARLMLDAYRGTIDDEGESLDDALEVVQGTFAGTSGALLEACSFVIEEWGEPLACTLVTWWDEQPLLAYVMTHPTAKNRGMGRFLIEKSVNALLAQGYRKVSLFVTRGNLPAQHLYERLGFQIMSTRGSAEVNGTHLFYEVAGAGHPLVLLHSGLTNCQMWDAQWETFAQEYRVIRYDLRGFGRSGAASGSFSHREDLSQLLRFLSVERAYLIGSSMGGQLAIDFALEHPEMVAALIPVGSGVNGEAPSDFLLERWREIDAAAEGKDVAQAVELELRLWVDGPGRTPEQVDPAVREQVRQMNTHNFERSEQEQGQPQPLEPPALSRLGEIRAPTLVLVGAYDVPDKLASADLLARGISGAKKVVMSGAAHLPSMEQPGPFNRLALEFLGRL
ncbi:MAG TPA: alpha/beta fold hydrolase [Ktedonobacterales bacterium]|jgi:pimeloyl-ACP methyl ester carboxylesterase